MAPRKSSNVLNPKPLTQDLTKPSTFVQSYFLNALRLQRAIRTTLSPILDRENFSYVFPVLDEILGFSTLGLFRGANGISVLLKISLGFWQL